MRLSQRFPCLTQLLSVFIYFSSNKTQVIYINQLLSAVKGDTPQEIQHCCSQNPSQQQQPHFKVRESKP